jgi:hypothetical protein
MFPVNEINEVSQKPNNTRSSSWPFEKQYFPNRKIQYQIPDGSRLSIKRIAPLFQHRMTDSTFISTIRIKPRTAFLSIEMFPGHFGGGGRVISL